MTSCELRIASMQTMVTMDRDPKKRVYSPTGRTPLKPKSKRAVPFRDRNVPTGQLSAKKKLTYQSTRTLYTPVGNWSAEEDRALTEFVLLSCVADSWPSTKSMKLWEGASKFLHNSCKTVRTSKKVVYIN